MADIQRLLKERIFLLDGAMGTSIGLFELKAEDFGGEEYEGCNEHLNLTRPDIITKVHEGYLEAGSDIIETNTFAGTSITLVEYGLENKDYEINKAAAGLAKQAAQKYSTQEKPRFVAGSIGPTNKTISVTSDVTFDELERSYYRQAKALIDGGVDILMIETVFDTLNAKAAFSAIDLLSKETGKELPIFLSATIEQSGTMLAGQDIESFYTSMEHCNLLGIGMNCALGPDLMKDHLRTLSHIAKTNVICYPNAGLPLEDSTFPLKPKKFAKLVKEFIDHRLVNIIGGCCGTTKEHIKELSRIIDNTKIRIIPDISRTALSGMETIAVDDTNKPLIIGERTNVIGSKKFKDLICEDNFEVAAEIGSVQVKKGAQILDICLANPDRDEVEDTKKFYGIITKKVRVPLMIDSTDHDVIEAALRRTQGKCIINSINFEDGTERISRVMPLAKKYGAAVIFGTIDEDKEQAIATTVEKKIEIAKRAYKYLTEEWNFPAHDILFDPLVFPIATGDPKYQDSAKLNLEFLDKIKDDLPLARTIMGVSNVSFGLPSAGREVINSVYLYHATKAGLDFAIFNSEKLMRYPLIPDEEKELAENLLFRRCNDPITPFVEFYRGKKVRMADVKKLPLAKRLPLYIIEGRKEGLIEDIDEALRKQMPIDIINGPLMKGMSEVGRLFNEHKLIVSEVLQSAESMKTAVAHLEKFMDKAQETKRYKVLVATVKGDVHDIGKNLFEIILANNGYDTVDLGIKVSPERLIEACHEHKPDIIGLSGLLVKSAHMMIDTAEDLRSAGINIPLIVGGAALTAKFAALKIVPAYGGVVAYSKDAMHGLEIIKQITKNLDEFKKKNLQLQSDIPKTSLGTLAEDSSKTVKDSIKDSTYIEDAPILVPPDFGQHIIEDYGLRAIFGYINPQTLFCSHLGLKGSYERLIKNKDKKALELTKQVNEVKDYIVRNNLIHPKAVYRFFECSKHKDSILVYEDDKIIETLEFPRQEYGEKLCVADFVSSNKDSFAMFVTSCGEGIIERSRELREKGEYIKSHILQVLAVESAEAFAEIVHQKIRGLFGIIEHKLTKQEIFQARYQGIRLSYGYPACPNLSQQRKLFRLLKPEQIGVHLTESMMMEPEASVSALVFHHPQAKYFNI